MNDIAIRRIEKTILEVMGKRYPGAKFDRDMRADFRAMAVAIAKSAPAFKAAQQAESEPLVTAACAGADTTSKPVAWRCRSTDEPKWNYGDKPLLKRDLFRKEPGFEEQPLYATYSLTSSKDAQ